ncbi:MAG: redoxin domain-containing protein [Chitinophagaceae bacterium]
MKNIVTVNDELSSIDGASEWINSRPLKSSGLKGKVVMVNFWTYTCINWLRTLPYTRVWAEKYKKQGLVMIGVHTPEFSFEHNPDNVRKLAAELKVDYPIVIDNDYVIWQGFSNSYWPAFYLIDAKGTIRYHQFGEGGYDESEKMIQKLLSEAGAVNVNYRLATPAGEGLEAAADWGDLQSPENYLGMARTQNFSSPGGMSDKRKVYTFPAQLSLNQWALEGDWTAKPEKIVLGKAGGKIKYRFHSRDLHLVMGPMEKGKSIRFRILIDGAPPGAAHGTDVDEKGNGVLTDQKLYQLVRQHSSIVDRNFEIEFLDNGVEAFSFTFG